MIDIFNPEVSTVTKGLEGKSLLLYGSNRVGKTSNAVKARKPVVLCAEQGLGALSGVPFFRINKWSKFTDFVKALTNPLNAEKAHQMYETIIIDTVEPLLNFAEDFVCASLGVQSVDRDSTGKKGFGVWRDFRKEVAKWINAITNAGFTVIFIAHEDTRTFVSSKGEEYAKIYPKGDKRSIDLLCDLCDFIAYAQTPASDEENGETKLATLYLTDTIAYKAGSRFTYLTPTIPEWNMDKLEAAINDAVVAEEKNSGVKAVEYSDVRKAEEKKAAEVAKNQLPIPELIDAIATKIYNMIEKDGNKAVYEQILEDEIGNKDFRCQEATEKQREQLEIILEALTNKGY